MLILADEARFITGQMLIIDGGRACGDDQRDTLDGDEPPAEARWPSSAPDV